MVVNKPMAYKELFYKRWSSWSNCSNFSKSLKNISEGVHFSYWTRDNSQLINIWLLLSMCYHVYAKLEVTFLRNYTLDPTNTSHVFNREKRKHLLVNVKMYLLTYFLKADIFQKETKFSRSMGVHYLEVSLYI